MVFAHGLQAWTIEQNTGQENGKRLPSFSELVDMKLQSLQFSYEHGFVERGVYEQGVYILNRFKQAQG